MSVEDRITKLPKWAQIEIGNLRREVNFYKGKLAEIAEGDPEKARVTLNVGGMVDIPLPDTARVTFKTGFDSEIEFRLEDKPFLLGGGKTKITHSEVMAYATGRNHNLLFKPSSSNVGYIGNVDFREFKPKDSEDYKRDYDELHGGSDE